MAQGEAQARRLVAARPWRLTKQATGGTLRGGRHVGRRESRKGHQGSIRAIREGGTADRDGTPERGGPGSGSLRWRGR